MPRDSSGNYTLPLPPVIPDTDIESTWANTTTDDVATEMSDSLSRSGKGGMTAPFKIFDGTVTAAGLGWLNEANSGLYRAAAGDLRFAVGGTDLTRWTATGFQVWASSTWNTVVFNPPVDGVTYGRLDGAWVQVPTAAQFTSLATDVQSNADNITANAIKIQDNTDDILALDAVGEAPQDSLYYGRVNATWAAVVEEAPDDGSSYVRQSLGWVLATSGANPNDLITAIAWDGQVMSHTRASGDFDVTVKVFTEFKSNGLIRHKCNDLGTSVGNPTINVDVSAANRHRVVNGAAFTLNFTNVPTTADNDFGVGDPNYHQEGQIVITNGTSPGAISITGFSAVSIGTQKTDASTRQILTYIIQRISGANELTLVWSN